VKAFIKTLPQRHQHRFAALFELLIEQGPHLKRPHADHVRGRIRELRVHFGAEQFRVLHAFLPSGTGVLLHAFRKVTQKLKQSDVQTAERRLVEVEERIKRGEIKA
jgi:phage-related protein